MLAAQVHIGTRNSDSQMQDYIWRRRQVMPIPFFFLTFKMRSFVFTRPLHVRQGAPRMDVSKRDGKKGKRCTVFRVCAR